MIVAKPTVSGSPPNGSRHGVQLLVHGDRWDGSVYRRSRPGRCRPGCLWIRRPGVLSGTPTAGGTSSFTVKVVDALGCLIPKGATLRIALHLAINGTPPTGEVGATYAFTYGLTGGTGPFTWTVSVGALPAGLFLNASTGQVTGIPSAARCDVVHAARGGQCEPVGQLRLVDHGGRGAEPARSRRRRAVRSRCRTRPR